MARALRIVPSSTSASLGKKQKRINSLVKAASEQRVALRAWRDADYHLARGSAAIANLIDQQRGTIRELTLLMHRHALDGAFSQVDRKQLAAMAVSYAKDLLSERPDDVEIKRVFNVHTQSDYDIERSDEEAQQAAVMQDVLEQHGLEFDRQFETLAELEAAARAAQAEREQATADRRARRKKSAKQAAAEERRHAATAQAGKALQEVYRQLVRTLHPDHERDPEERARKTALMQEVNVAYERGDLLELLELQLRIEQIDPERIGGLAEDRLDHFIKLLGDQVKQLRDELAMIEHPYRVQLDVYPPRKLPPAAVLASMRDDADQLALRLAEMKRDLRTMADVAGMKAWLREQRERSSREARAFADLMSLVGTAELPRRRR